MPGNTRRASERAHAARGIGKKKRSLNSNALCSDEKRVLSFKIKLHTAMREGGREGIILGLAMPGPAGWGDWSTWRAWMSFSEMEEPRQLEATRRWREWLSSDWMEDPHRGSPTQRRIRDIIVSETAFEAGE